MKEQQRAVIIIRKIKKELACFIILLILLMMALPSVSHASETIILGKVEQVTAEDKNGDIKICWKGVNYAQAYEVFRVDADEQTTRLTILVGNHESFLDETAEWYQGYLYTVRAIRFEEEDVIYGEFSDYASVQKLPTPPQKLEGYLTQEGFKLSWEGQKGVTGYEIFGNDGDGYQRLAVLNGDLTGYIDPDMVVGKTRMYRVRSFVKIDDTYNYSEYSEPAILNVKLQTPAILSGTYSKKGLYLTWQGSEMAHGYEVFRKADGQWKKVEIELEKINSGWDTEFTSGGTAAYVIRAYRKTENGYLYSDFSEEIQLNNQLGQVKIYDVVRITKTQNAIVWNGCDYADGYEIYRRINGEQANFERAAIQWGRDTKFLDTKLKVGVEYEYQIRAFCQVNTKAGNEYIYGILSEIKKESRE